MGISLAQLLLILIIILILFGAGRLPHVMGQIGKGLKNFKESMKSEEKHDNSESKKDEK